MSTIEAGALSRQFVVGVAGAPGAGKTSLAQALAQSLGARTLDYDRYRPLTKLPVTDIRAWFARGGDPNEIDHSEIVADLERDTRLHVGARSALVFETPFGRLHRASGAYIDFLVWIDAPLDLSLSRAMLAFTKAARARDEPAAGFLDWQAQYLANYPFLREMYLVQSKRIAPEADLTLDGAAPVEAWVARIEAALRDHPGAAGIGRSSASS